MHEYLHANAGILVAHHSSNTDVLIVQQGVLAGQASAAGNSHGINQTFASYLGDETARHVKKFPYRCTYRKVRSTGNAVVDRVRESLSWNDIVVSQRTDLMAKQRIDSLDRVNAFKKHLYSIITGDTLNVIEKDCKELQGYCINAYQKTYQGPKSKKIDSTFFKDVASSSSSSSSTRRALRLTSPTIATAAEIDPASDCLKLAVVKGKFDCKFWLRDGLAYDIAALKTLDNQPIRSAVRGRDPGWNVEASRMPDDSLEHTKDFSEVALTSKLFSFVRRVRIRAIQTMHA